MSFRFFTVCAVGLVGSLFIGYCIYFDRKRRSDPDYKKKVLARRRMAAKKKSLLDLRDPKVREEFLMGEMSKANQKLMEGNIEEGVAHLINFIQFSGNPRASLLTLQQTLPQPIFSLVVRAFAALQQQQGAQAKQREDVEVD